MNEPPLISGKNPVRWGDLTGGPAHPGKKPATAGWRLLRFTGNFPETSAERSFNLPPGDSCHWVAYPVDDWRGSPVSPAVVSYWWIPLTPCQRRTLPAPWPAGDLPFFPVLTVGDVHRTRQLAGWLPDRPLSPENRHYQVTKTPFPFPKTVGRDRVLDQPPLAPFGAAIVHRTGFRTLERENPRVSPFPGFGDLFPQGLMAVSR